MWRLIAGAALLLASVAWGAEERRMMSEAEARGARAVGKLNISGNRFCSATLISERLVLTAAHCLFHPVSKRQLPPGAFRFVAGQRHESEAAVRRVGRIARLPGFSFDPPASLRNVGDDLALLELSEPIDHATVAPIPVAGPSPGADLDIISYARDRPYEPSIQGPCPVVTFAPRIGILNCAVTFGASGAPVVMGEGDERRVVAVVSAIGKEHTGGDVALVVPVEARMGELRAALERSPANP